MAAETPERWRRIAALFDEALKLAPARRPEYLESACAGDVDLYQRVVELLDASGQAAGFLERPIVSRAADILGGMAKDLESSASPPAEAHFSSEPTHSTDDVNTVAQTVGPNLLIHKIGEGGMGEVWLAEQREPIRRKVALKVIKAGMDTKQVVARFEVERQALALMDHPAIAKVFDAGETPDHRPYFVMEYVPGVPITEHCDRQRLTNRERLELFLQLCDGVQHAHQKAVIHRDLKPSNVLVSLQDGHAAVRIIDFGVAKAISQRLTERTLFTELGVMIGTPEYMSPEQAELTNQDVDTRSDVYSLGVMLYELLVGALPFESKELRQGGYDELRRRIRELDPPRPSVRLLLLREASTESARRRRTEPKALRRELHGDLDWITMRALEKDRARRYRSPAELAADIERYIRDQPVEAGPPRASYRARKFVRRHRFGVGAAVVAIMALLAFAATMVVQAARIARERDRANIEAEDSRQVSEFLKGLFQAPSPFEAKGAAVTAREILDRGAERITHELGAQPLVQARLMDTMGAVYRQMGLLEKARPLISKGLAIREQIEPDGLEVAANRGTSVRRTRESARRGQQPSLGPAGSASHSVRSSLPLRRNLFVCPVTRTHS